MDCAVAVQGMRGGQWEPLIKKSSALVFINNTSIQTIIIIYYMIMFSS